jgi:thiamine-phosphate pyrophosphorylase
MPPARVLRILDASLNRAGEGLRVVEDYARFVLDDPFLTGETKRLRHDLTNAAATISSTDRRAARDALGDVGPEVAAIVDGTRDDPWHVCAASLKRVQQSLRSLEEYGKLIDASFAQQMESLRYRLYTLEKALDAGRSSRERLEGINLCVLIDGQNTAADFENLVRDLVGAGVGILQLRDKSLDDRELISRARMLVSLTRGRSPAEPGADGRTHSRTLAIINDRADIAAAVNADGVHLGQEDLSVKDARAVVGTQMLIGVSTHNIVQAQQAVLDGANYLGAGPTFTSRTKEFNSFAGLAYLREVAAVVRLPTFAIGGINADTLPDVLSVGITRVAVSAAVIAAEKPGSAARKLLDMLNNPVHPSAKAASPSLAPRP